MNTLARKMMPKKWNQVYTERAEEIKRQWAERDRIESEERELMLKSRRERMENLKRIESLEYPYENNDEEEEENQLVNSPVKSKYKKPIMDCKRTIYNLAPPASQMDWHEHWGSSLLCYICDKPAVTEMTRCPKCNVVAHILCVNSQPMRYDRPDGQDLCPHCEESRRKEQEFYEQEIERLKYQRLLEISAAMVTRRALVYLAMKRYDRTRQSIRRIQAVCRGIIARLRYRIQRRAFLRVVLLSILHLPNIPEQVLRNGLMVVTIMDTFKGNQIFRFDQSLETVLEEKILIPGLASYMTMVFTLCTKEEVYTYSMIAQAQLCIRDMVNPSKRKDVNLNFLEKIQWVPQDCDGISRSLTFVPNSDPNLIASFRALNDSSIRIRYHPQNPVLYFCMWASGPPLDLLRRSQQVLSNKKKPEALSGTGTYRNSRYWLATTHNVLWFYQYYGDNAPRFGVQIHESSAAVVKEKRRTTTLANLNLSDGRAWLLDFNSKADALRFEVAINENRKAHQSRSIYIKSSEAMAPVPNLGFTVPFFN